MINRDRKCMTLTEKIRSYKKAKFMNSDIQTGSQIDRQTDRKTDQQTVRPTKII